MQKETINNVQSKKQEFIRGGIYLVDIGVGKGSIQGKVRPCILISNKACNTYSSVLHCVPVSSATTKSKLPTHITLISKETGLIRDSIALCEQTMLVTKDSIGRQLGFCNENIMKMISNGVAIQFGLIEVKNNVVYA